MKTWGNMPASEFQAGNLTLAVMQSDAFGIEFAQRARWSRSRSMTSRRRASDSRAQGIEFRGEILDSGVCHQAFFADPDGNLLALHHRYAPKD